MVAKLGRNKRRGKQQRLLIIVCLAPLLIVSGISIFIGSHSHLIHHITFNEFLGGHTGDSNNSHPNKSSSLIDTFNKSIDRWNIHRSSGVFSSSNCPPQVLQTWPVPPSLPPSEWGTPCEPALTRGTIEILANLVGPGMSAFQWGIGSSTYWLLSSLGIDRLTTIAHDARHVSTAHTVIPDNLKSKWTVHIIPPVAQPITFQQAESYVHYFRAYSDLTGIVTGTSSDGDGDSSINDFKTQRQQYDVVLVDGQSRSSCLTRAVSLLKPEGGVLILAGAQRGGYQEATQSVPPHWKRYRDRNAMGLESVIWMSCVVNERGEYDGGGGDRRLNDDV